MKNVLKTIISALVISILLTACGGSGDGGKSSESKYPIIPEGLSVAKSHNKPVRLWVAKPGNETALVCAVMYKIKTEGWDATKVWYLAGQDILFPPHCSSLTNNSSAYNVATALQAEGISVAAKPFSQLSSYQLGIFKEKTTDLMVIQIRYYQGTPPNFQTNQPIYGIIYYPVSGLLLKGYFTLANGTVIE